MTAFNNRIQSLHLNFLPQLLHNFILLPARPYASAVLAAVVCLCVCLSVFISVFLNAHMLNAESILANVENIQGGKRTVLTRSAIHRK